MCFTIQFMNRNSFDIALLLHDIVCTYPNNIVRTSYGSKIWQYAKIMNFNLMTSLFQINDCVTLLHYSV